MAITVQHKKEALGQAYVHAIIAHAGYNLGASQFDYGFDGSIKEVVNRNGRYFENGIALNYQLKSSCNVIFQDGNIIYDLESKNYNDLVAECAMMPSILILFILPSTETEWLDVTVEQLIIKKCAWWCSLVGLPPTTNDSTKRITIPCSQVFSPETLIHLMEKVKGGEKL